MLTTVRRIRPGPERGQSYEALTVQMEQHSISTCETMEALGSDQSRWNFGVSQADCKQALDEQGLQLDDANGCGLVLLPCDIAC